MKTKKDFDFLVNLIQIKRAKIIETYERSDKSLPFNDYILRKNNPNSELNKLYRDADKLIKKLNLYSVSDTSQSDSF